MPRMTETDKMRMRQLRNQGLSYRDIASIVGCDFTTIVYWLNHQHEKIRARDKARRRRKDSEKYRIDLNRSAEANRKRYANDPEYRKEDIERSIKWAKENHDRNLENKRKWRAKRKALGLPVT